MNDQCTIELTRGQAAIVDAADFEWLSQWKWCAHQTRATSGFYAQRGEWDGRRVVTVWMHRVILGLQRGDPMRGDHINRNPLDNRRSNLRIATQAQNACNSNAPYTNTSGFKGVTFAPRIGKFRARINVDGKRVHLGYRPTAIEAYWDLYVPAALQYKGEFAAI